MKALLFIISIPLLAVDYVDRTVLLLDVNASKITVTNSGSGAATATALGFSPGSGNRVKVWASQANIPNRGAGASCVDPCSITMNLNYGSPYYFFEVVDGTGASFTPARVGQGRIPQVLASTEACAVLPLEILGVDDFRRSLSCSVPAGSATTGLSMWLRIDNPWWTIGENATRAKGSFRINSGAWIDITCAGKIIDQNQWAGCYNGPQTVELSIAVPDSSITANAANTFEFRVNSTDGNSSGYRVLGFNLIETPKTFSSAVVTSNSAAVTITSHGYSTGNTLLIYNAPGMRGRFNGLRSITVTGANAFTFTACGTNPNLLSCTSPNGTYSVPTSLRPVTFPQPVASVARAILPASAFSWDNPAIWAAPGSGNAATGATLWASATLLSSNAPYFNNQITAKCASCHATDGKDLKYFNYSNWSIVARSLFHGLSVQNGLDIAAYIRGLSISVPAGARPWNPPYQPGPGITSGVVADWSAGAGIDSVLTYDQDSKEYMVPGGSYATWAPGSLLDPKNIPLQWGMPPWNIWLPAVYPGDGFSTFAANILKTYTDTALTVTPGNISSFNSTSEYLGTLKLYLYNFRVASGQDTVGIAARRPSQFSSSYYSIALWASVRTWEIFKVKQFEEDCDAIYTARNGSNRSLGWCWAENAGIIFDTAPHKTIKFGDTNTATSTAASEYWSNLWYVLQFILNGGNGWLIGDKPVDIPYSYAHLGKVGIQQPNSWVGTIPTFMGLQHAWARTLPDLNHWTWMRFITSDLESTWAYTSTANRTELMTAWANLMNDLIGHYSGANWTTFAASNPSCSGSPGSAAWNAYLQSVQTPCGTIQLMLPLMVYYSVPAASINSIQSWAAGLWPGHNFTVDRAATCTLNAAAFPICTNNYYP